VSDIKKLGAQLKEQAGLRDIPWIIYETKNFFTD
jgi:hypothetical protein